MNTGSVSGGGPSARQEMLLGPAVAAVDPDQPGAKAYWRQSLSAFAENRMGVAGLVVLAAIVAFSWLGPVLHPTNQFAANLLLENEAPSIHHLLGTTPQGRDELGALMVGGQSTLEVGIGVGVISTLFGLVWGAFAGYVGGLVDAFMMRIVDALLSIPFLFFVVLLASLVQPTLFLIILVIAAVSWLPTARLARGETLTLRTHDYVAASRAFGARSDFILRHHISQNLVGIVVVERDLESRRRDHALRRDQLPRSRGPAAGDELGEHLDGRRDEPLRRLLVAAVAGGRAHRGDRRRGEPHRGRGARHRRAALAGALSVWATAGAVS